MSGIIGKREVRGSGIVNRDTSLVTSVSGSTGVVADSDIDHDSLANFASNEHYTQANITALGTVTSGNISHADIVFPDHHVVQVIQSRIDGTIAIDNTSYMSTTHSAAITPASGNKVLVMLSLVQPYMDAERNMQGAVYRDIAGGGYAANFDAWDWNIGNPDTGFYLKGGTTCQMYLDSPSASGSQVVTYLVYAKVSAGSQQYHNGSGFHNTLTLMEIVA